MNSDLFFKNKRLNFFSPLTGPYREIAVSCIRNLYLRLNGPEADYSYHLARKNVIDIFVESIRIAPTLDDEGSDGTESRMSAQDRAAWMLRRLKEAGWIEAYMDSGNMQTAYRFTAQGRQFAAPFAQHHSEIITNTQHTRSTLSHLKSFLNQLHQNIVSVGDLMIATKLSGEIISDFNEIIEEIVEQRRELIASVSREIQDAKNAGNNFFEFMEKRFVPDMSVRFSQDSVERYKNEILDLLEAIRSLPDPVKAKIERQLRNHYPNLLKPDRPSILVWALDLVEQRLTAACDVKMPELRTQTENFIRRAQVLINHLASLAFGEIETRSVYALVKRLSRLDAQQVQTVLSDRRSRYPRMHIRMVDPGRITPPQGRTRREIKTVLEKEVNISPEERRLAYIRRELALAFRIEESKVSDYVVRQLAQGHKVTASDFTITDAASLLGALHAPMVGSVRAGRNNRFKVSPMAEKVDNDFYTGDNFSIEYAAPENEK